MKHFFKVLLVVSLLTPVTAKVFAQSSGASANNMVRINGGTFTMGSPTNELGRENDETQHRVTVSSFFIGKFPVTQREYRDTMGKNPSEFKGDNRPVDMVSWYDAIEYCNERSRREGLTPAYAIDKSRKDPNNEGTNDSLAWLVTWNRSANGYRLPTEAEWEYACRAGTVTPFNTGNSITSDQANYDGGNPYGQTVKGKYRKETTTVGIFTQNSFGLGDMHGNVWEWCWDWYGDYGGEATTNPQGMASGAFRVERGGAWHNHGTFLRSAYRGSFNPPHRGSDLGFRIARN